MNNYLSGLLITCSVTTLAQTRVDKQDTMHLSLKQVWIKAEENSRLVAMKDLSVRIAQEEIKDVKTERLPELGVKGTAEKASNIPIYENGLFSRPSQHEVIHTLYRVGADFYLNIYNGNKLNLKMKESETLLKLSRIGKDKALSNIRYQAAALYLDLQKSFIFRKLIREDISDQEKQLKEIKAYHRHGVSLKSDVLRAELELSRRKMALITIENDILIANQKLNILLGTPDELAIIPRETNDSGGSDTTYDDYLKLALSHSFDYHISEQQTHLSKIRLDEVKANVRPKIGIYSEFYYANPQIFLFPYNPYWYSLGVVGLKATFPISSLYHNPHKVRAAKLEFEKEEVAHKDTEDQVRQQVKEAYLRYQEALEQIKVAEVDEAQAVENARIIKNTYFKQASLITDLLDADIQVLQSRFDLARARIMALNNYYLLQNIAGIL